MSHQTFHHCEPSRCKTSRERCKVKSTTAQYAQMTRRRPGSVLASLFVLWSGGCLCWLALIAHLFGSLQHRATHQPISAQTNTYNDCLRLLNSFTYPVTDRSFMAFLLAPGEQHKGSFTTQTEPSLHMAKETGDSRQGETSGILNMGGGCCGGLMQTSGEEKVPAKVKRKKG